MIMNDHLGWVSFMFYVVSCICPQNKHDCNSLSLSPKLKFIFIYECNSSNGSKEKQKDDKLALWWTKNDNPKQKYAFDLC